MDVKYISRSIGAGLLEAFCHSMGMNIYDVTTNGGYCLCYVAIECSANDAQIVFIQVTEHKKLRTLSSAVLNVRVERYAECNFKTPSIFLYVPPLSLSCTNF